MAARPEKSVANWAERWNSSGHARRGALSDRLRKLNRFIATSTSGRVEPVRQRRTSRSSGKAEQQWDQRQLSLALRTLMTAMAAEPKVGLMALTVSSPTGADRLLTLQSRPSRPLGDSGRRLTPGAIAWRHLSAVPFNAVGLNSTAKARPNLASDGPPDLSSTATVRSTSR